MDIFGAVQHLRFLNILWPGLSLAWPYGCIFYPYSFDCIWSLLGLVRGNLGTTEPANVENRVRLRSAINFINFFKWTKILLQILKLGVEQKKKKAEKRKTEPSLNTRAILPPS